MAKPAEFTLFMNYAEKVKEFLTKNAYLKKIPQRRKCTSFFCYSTYGFF